MGQDVEIVGIHDQVRGGGNQHLRLSDYHLLCSDPVSVDDGLDLLLPSTSHCWDDQRRVRDDDCAKNRHIHSSLHRCKQRIVPSSELVKPASQFLVRRFRTLRSLQQLLGFRYSGVPLIHASLSAFGPSSGCKSGHTPSGPECGSLFPEPLFDGPPPSGRCAPARRGRYCCSSRCCTRRSAGSTVRGCGTASARCPKPSPARTLSVKSPPGC